MQHLLEYIDGNRKQLTKRYKTFADFNRNFTVPTALTDSIFADGRRKKVEPKDKEELTETVAELSLQLKALIARDLWSLNEYYQIYNKENMTLRKALQVIAEGEK